MPARNTGHAPQSLAQRLTESYTCILDCVMLIDVKIPLGADFDVDQRMTGQLLQHMVEEAYAGGNRP
jgi:hypothetical protein